MSAGAILAGIDTGLQIYSALSARKGQESSNSAEMEFNHNEAELDRAWQEKMFRNRYQFTRQDLEAAGYNPLLAMGLNPGVPSGAVANAHPKSTTEEFSKIMAHSAKNVSEVGLTSALMAKTKAEAASAAAVARMTNQEADIATSPGGRKLAEWRYFMDKSGVGRGLSNIAQIFGAKTAAKNFKPNISFGSGSSNRSGVTSYSRRNRDRD